MFKELETMNSRPTPFEFYTADALWTDNHTSKKMLESHLKEDFEVSIQNREFINRSVDWIVNHFGLNQNRRVADFGCGMGSYATRLAENRVDVTGIDFSETFIRHAKEVAKQKGLDINYVQQNYLEFETEEQFDLITLLLCDFCALSPLQRKTMLEKFYKLLNPGGSVLVDVYSAQNGFWQ